VNGGVGFAGFRGSVVVVREVIMPKGKHFLVQSYYGTSEPIKWFKDAVDYARKEAMRVCEEKGLFSLDYHVDITDESEYTIVRFDALRLRVYRQEVLSEL